MKIVYAILCVLLVLGMGATTEPTTAPSTVTVIVGALIDGRSRLSLKDNTARWQNFDFAAPGKQAGRDEATVINGQVWHPTWDDSDLSPEVRVSKSLSDTFDRVEPPLAAEATVVTLEKIHCREKASIVQQPTAENDFTTIVEFDDDQSGGADWYEVKLTFAPPGQ